MNFRILKAEGKYDYHNIKIHHFMRKDSKEKSWQMIYTQLREIDELRRRNNEKKA